MIGQNQYSQNREYDEKEVTIRSDEYKTVRETQRKILKACLAEGILARMAGRNVTHVRDMLLSFENEFSIRLSPGTIYPVVYSLEKRGNIQRLAVGSKNVYIITARGRDYLQSLQQNSSLFHLMLSKILKA